jgi:Metal-sensitive transcriptional repressor
MGPSAREAGRPDHDDMPNWGTAIGQLLEAKQARGRHGAQPSGHREAPAPDRGAGERHPQDAGGRAVLQISAARAGLEATALLILEDHVNGCIREAIDEGKGDEKAAELLEAVGRFARSM